MLKRLYERNNSPRDMASIVQLLNDGGVLIYPTDTVYAIGCHALKERAVERICKLKGIDLQKKNLSIICHEMKQISEYAKVDNDAFKLMKLNIPGPFTFVLPTSSRLPKIFRGRKEVGIRVPDNDIVREICRLLEAPLMTTSLPYDEDDDIEYLTTPELIDEKWGEKVDMVIDGGVGGTSPCTVVSLMDNEVEILRQGVGELDM
ncbi:MAG: threonylcarbamoyl-AMP synthase [Bacteroidaceae bacterium]|nr:threonylcarbamoyl-AMP synthase [Bacteroidaceae bacterium]